MKKNNHQALRATLLLVVMLVGAVAALYRVPVASAAPAMEVVPGDPIPEIIPEETVPETTEAPTEAPEDPEPYRPVPQHEHNVVVDSVDATCTQDGYVHEYCSTCGVSLSYTPIAALGHDYHETARVEPQIGVDGYIEYTCVRNDDSYRTPLEALPEPEETEEEEEEPAHTHVKVVTHVAATCTTDGYKHVECYECGEVLEHTVVPAHGHSWNGWHVVRAATYETEGLEQHECTKCGVVETRPIAKLTRPVEEEEPTEPAPTEPAPTEPPVEDERESISGDWDIDF